MRKFDFHMELDVKNQLSSKVNDPKEALCNATEPGKQEASGSKGKLDFFSTSEAATTRVDHVDYPE